MSRIQSIADLRLSIFETADCRLRLPIVHCPFPLPHSCKMPARRLTTPSVVAALYKPDAARLRTVRLIGATARQGPTKEDASERSEASRMPNGAEPAKRLARERVGESEGRSPKRRTTTTSDRSTFELHVTDASVTGPGDFSRG